MHFFRSAIVMSLFLLGSFSAQTQAPTEDPVAKRLREKFKASEGEFNEVAINNYLLEQLKNPNTDRTLLLEEIRYFRTQMSNWSAQRAEEIKRFDSVPGEVASFRAQETQADQGKVPAAFTEQYIQSAREALIRQHTDANGNRNIGDQVIDALLAKTITKEKIGIEYARYIAAQKPKIDEAELKLKAESTGVRTDASVFAEEVKFLSALELRTQYEAGVQQTKREVEDLERIISQPGNADAKAEIGPKLEKIRAAGFDPSTASETFADSPKSDFHRYKGPKLAEIFQLEYNGLQDQTGATLPPPGKSLANMYRARAEQMKAEREANPTSPKFSEEKHKQYEEAGKYGDYVGIDHYSAFTYFDDSKPDASRGNAHLSLDLPGLPKSSSFQQKEQVKQSQEAFTKTKDKAVAYAKENTTLLRAAARVLPGPLSGLEALLPPDPKKPVPTVAAKKVATKDLKAEKKKEAKLKEASEILAARKEALASAKKAGLSQAKLSAPTIERMENFIKTDKIAVPKDYTGASGDKTTLYDDLYALHKWQFLSDTDGISKKEWLKRKAHPGFDNYDASSKEAEEAYRRETIKDMHERMWLEVAQEDRTGESDVTGKSVDDKLVRYMSSYLTHRVMYDGDGDGAMEFVSEMDRKTGKCVKCFKAESKWDTEALVAQIKKAIQEDFKANNNGAELADDDPSLNLRVSKILFAGLSTTQDAVARIRANKSAYAKSKIDFRSTSDQNNIFAGLSWNIMGAGRDHLLNVAKKVRPKKAQKNGVDLGATVELLNRLNGPTSGKNAAIPDQDFGIIEDSTYNLEESMSHRDVRLKTPPKPVAKPKDPRMPARVGGKIIPYESGGPSGHIH